jgi:hypothetical protein
VVELLVVGGVLGGLFLLGGIAFVVLAALKLVFWLVFLPIRLAFKLLFLPLLLVKWLFLGVLGLALAPLLVIGLVIGAIGVVAALIVPLMPLIFVGFAVWAIVHLLRRPAVA